MDALNVFVLVVAFVLLLGGALALWRFAKLRSKGTPVIIRPIPAQDGGAWRHGVFKYTDCTAFVYKLRSLRPGADLSFPRSDVEILSRREPTTIEAGFFDRGLHVVVFSVAGQGEWELAVDDSGDTALVAWVESSPSVRQTRRLPTNIEERFRRVRARGAGEGRSNGRSGGGRR
ncbi:DUF2550 domain-containing protein [Corynebacterium hansenii]|uniref:DUF2550 domain-containing protein n=1 Tax=Corynebacterium hansenii TaxID=394964 RepID=A0ABV7ZLB0_9CORY|nr:DUF2550 domain-containing protein [Corynebacterium hansenii]WJY99577.1 hypothetical protein CHAN_04775 [Corynebacterium hansenii]